MQGDCLERMKEIPDGSVDMILTDVPYKVITGGDSDGKNSKRPKGMLSGNRELMKSVPKFEDWLPECYRVLKNDTHAYFMVNYTNLIKLHLQVEKAGFKVHNLLVWQKNNNTPSQFYMKNCEYIIFARKGKAKWINDIGGSKTVHQFNNVLGNKVHPTEKPVDLMEFYISNSSDENDTILDPFMGSGTTGVACVNLNRNFIGIELDEGYFDIAKKRIDDTVKKKENDIFGMGGLD
jgi:site-specific DNA-methyltransferase (adenine-specific)